MNFKEELKRRTEEAEHVIREYLPEESGFAKTMVGHELQYDGRWKETSPDPDQGNLRAVWRKG